MSFKSRDLMIDVLPARKFNALAQPGFGMCPQGTANTGTEEDEEKDCAQGTATNEPAYAPRAEVNLALLRQQLQEALSSEARA